jgi:phospholipid/cholesterol/gamma-HCH transport system substrate-binding protein
MASEERTAAWAGLFVLVTGAVLVAGIAVLGQRSQLFRRHYLLRAEFGNIQGLAVGASVRVAGVIVGSVSAIRISPRLDVKKVVVYLSVERDYQSRITGDSVASIRTLGMLGDKYVEITIGSATRPQLVAGQTLLSKEPIDLFEIADEGRSVVARLNKVAGSLEAVLVEFESGHAFTNLSRASASLANIVSEIQHGQGAAHTLIYDPKFKDLLTDLKASSQSFREVMEKATRTEGGLGQMLFGEEYGKLAVRLRETVDTVSRITEHVEKSESLLHSLIYDSEKKKLLADLGVTAARLNSVLEKADGTQGTFGLLLNDPSVWESLERLLGNLERSRTLKFFISRSLGEDQSAPAPGK